MLIMAYGGSEQWWPPYSLKGQDSRPIRRYCHGTAQTGEELHPIPYRPPPGLLSLLAFTQDLAVRWSIELSKCVHRMGSQWTPRGTEGGPYRYTSPGSRVPP